MSISKEDIAIDIDNKVYQQPNIKRRSVSATPKISSENTQIFQETPFTTSPTSNLDNDLTTILANLNDDNIDDMIWHDSIERILSELADEAQINSYLHNKAHLYYSAKNIRYQLPIIVLSAISGSGNFVSTNFPSISNYIIIGIGCLSIVTSIISSVAQFLKLSELSEGNRMSYLNWEKFHHNIKFQLRKKRTFRDNIKEFLNNILQEYQRLKEISPIIPNHISDIIRKKRKKVKAINEMVMPSYIDAFHHIRPYTKKDEVQEILVTKPPKEVLIKKMNKINSEQSDSSITSNDEEDDEYDDKNISSQRQIPMKSVRYHPDNIYTTHKNYKKNSSKPESYSKNNRTKHRKYYNRGNSDSNNSSCNNSNISDNDKSDNQEEITYVNTVKKTGNRTGNRKDKINKNVDLRKRKIPIINSTFNSSESIISVDEIDMMKPHKNRNKQHSNNANNISNSSTNKSNANMIVPDDMNENMFNMFKTFMNAYPNLSASQQNINQSINQSITNQQTNQQTNEENSLDLTDVSDVVSNITDETNKNIGDSSV